MVSFQCDGCSDVIKKPALQKHYARCHASVSCLDCSQTFQGPREFMSHVRCISEAEKYQGALYKGRKHSDSSSRKNDNRSSGDKHEKYRGGGDGEGLLQSCEPSSTNTKFTESKAKSYVTPPNISPKPTSPDPSPTEDSSKETYTQNKPHQLREKDAATDNSETLKQSSKRKRDNIPSTKATPGSDGVEAVKHKKKKADHAKSPPAEPVTSSTACLDLGKEAISEKATPEGKQEKDQQENGRANKRPKKSHKYRERHKSESTMVKA